MTKQELQQRLEQAKARAKEAVTDKVETARMQAQLTLLESPSFIDAQARAELRKHATETLTQYADMCATIVKDNPLQNRRTRSERTWNPTKQYGLGNHVAELTGLLSGIQYSVRDHADLMYSVVPLNPDLVEDTLNAFGSLPYYSANNNIVVEGVQADLDRIQTNLSLIEAELGITIDKTHLTQSVLDTRYATALKRAQLEKVEAELTAETQHFVVR